VKRNVVPEESDGLLILACLLLTTIKHLKPYFKKCTRQLKPCPLLMVLAVLRRRKKVNILELNGGL
jgi:hypothetical protein